MSPAAAEKLRFHLLEQTDEPDVRARQQMILKWTLDALPDERRKIVDEGIEKGQLVQARAAVRNVLEARGFTLQAEEAARVEGCTNLETLERWQKQAVVAASVAEALRLG